MTIDEGVCFCICYLFWFLAESLVPIKIGTAAWLPTRQVTRVGSASFWSVLRSQAQETMLNLLNLTWPREKKHKTFPGTFSATFPRNPLNLTWFCTMVSWKIIQDLFRKLVEPDLALHRSLPDLLQNLLRNLVEPDLALHQSLPDLLRDLFWNLLRNPVELNLAWHLPDLLQNLFRNC